MKITSVLVGLTALFTFSLVDAELNENKLVLNLDRPISDAIPILMNEGGFGDPKDMKTYKTHGSHYSIVKDDVLDKHVIRVMLHTDDFSSWRKEPDTKQRHELVQQTVVCDEDVDTIYHAGFWMKFGSIFETDGFYHVMQLKASKNKNPINLSVRNKGKSLFITYGNTGQNNIELMDIVPGEWNYFSLKSHADRRTATVEVYNLEGKKIHRHQYENPDRGKYQGTLRLHIGQYRSNKNNRFTRDTVNYYADVQISQGRDIKLPSFGGSKPKPTLPKPEPKPDPKPEPPSLRVHRDKYSNPEHIYDSEYQSRESDCVKSCENSVRCKGTLVLIDNVGAACYYFSAVDTVLMDYPGANMYK